MYKMNETVLSVVYCSVNMKTMGRRFGLAKGRAKESHRRESHACKQCNLDLRSTPRSIVTTRGIHTEQLHACIYGTGVIGRTSISSRSLSIDPRVTGFTSTLLEHLRAAAHGEYRGQQGLTQSQTCNGSKVYALRPTCGQWPHSKSAHAWRARNQDLRSDDTVVARYNGHPLEGVTAEPSDRTWRDSC